MTREAAIAALWAQFYCASLIVAETVVSASVIPLTISATAANFADTAVKEYLRRFEWGSFGWQQVEREKTWT